MGTHSHSLQCMPDPGPGYRVLLMKVVDVISSELPPTTAKPYCQTVLPATANYIVLVPTMYWQLDLCLSLSGSPLGRIHHLDVGRPLANVEEVGQLDRPALWGWMRGNGGRSSPA